MAIFSMMMRMPETMKFIITSARNIAIGVNMMMSPVFQYTRNKSLTKSRIYRFWKKAFPPSNAISPKSRISSSRFRMQ